MINKKRKVLIAAQHLFIEKGFTDTSVQDIIDEAKISKGTFYNYFSSKNECVIEILENAREETALKRRELLVYQDISDQGILIEQISIRMKIYRDRNLMPIFVAIFQAQDSGLSEFIKKNHYEEIKWLAERLVDVFGKQTKKVSLDCAVLMLGMIQQMQHPWTLKSKEISMEELVGFIMRRVESMIDSMIDTNDSLIDPHLFENFYEDVEITKKHVLDQLKSFKQQYLDELKENELQHIEFILEELSLKKPRKYILEAVIHSFSDTFKKTSYHKQLTEVIANIWKLIDETY